MRDGDNRLSGPVSDALVLGEDLQVPWRGDEEGKDLGQEFGINTDDF